MIENVPENRLASHIEQDFWERKSVRAKPGASSSYGYDGLQYLQPVRAGVTSNSKEK